MVLVLVVCLGVWLSKVVWSPKFVCLSMFANLGLLYSDGSPAGPSAVVGQFFAVVVVYFFDGAYFDVVGVAAAQSADDCGLSGIEIDCGIPFFGLVSAFFEALILGVSDFVSGHVVLFVPAYFDLALAC